MVYRVYVSIETRLKTFNGLKVLCPCLEAGAFSVKSLICDQNRSVGVSNEPPELQLWLSFVDRSLDRASTPSIARSIARLLARSTSVLISRSLDRLLIARSVDRSLDRLLDRSFDCSLVRSGPRSIALSIAQIKNLNCVEAKLVTGCSYASTMGSFWESLISKFRCISSAISILRIPEIRISIPRIHVLGWFLYQTGSKNHN